MNEVDFIIFKYKKKIHYLMEKDRSIVENAEMFF